jgi:hypothetical protein
MTLDDQQITDLQPAKLKFGIPSFKFRNIVET